MSKTMKAKKRKNPARFRHAYAIVLYRYTHKGNLQVFLAHENSPRYWGSGVEHWGFPKGRADEGETPFETAAREFEEEIGCPLPEAEYRFLIHHVRFKARRQVTVFTAEATTPVRFGGCEPVTKQHPKTGEIRIYHEILGAKWVNVKKAQKIILPGQKAILKALLKTVPARS